MKLGINIDHVATLRNARGGAHPSVMRALWVCKSAGADSVTIHLREDRRHIRDQDVKDIIQSSLLPVNFEMAATDEMLSIALEQKPFAVCIVPEKRAELTTEGGLDVVKYRDHLKPYIAALNEAKIRTSLFVDPDLHQIQAAKDVGATCIEIHTGSYAETFGSHNDELNAIQKAAETAHRLGLEVHAGHGLNYENVPAIAQIPEIVELNIGHFLIGEALFTGLEQSIRQMQLVIKQARQA